MEGTLFCSMKIVVLSEHGYRQNMNQTSAAVRQGCGVIGVAANRSNTEEGLPVANGPSDAIRRSGPAETELEGGGASLGNNMPAKLLPCALSCFNSPTLRRRVPIYYSDCVSYCSSFSSGSVAMSRLHTGP